MVVLVKQRRPSPVPLVLQHEVCKVDLPTAPAQEKRRVFQQNAPAHPRVKRRTIHRVLRARAGRPLHRHGQAQEKDGAPRNLCQFDCSSLFSSIDSFWLHLRLRILSLDNGLLLLANTPPSEHNYDHRGYSDAVRDQENAKPASQRESGHRPRAPVLRDDCSFILYRVKLKHNHDTWALY